MSRAGAPRSDRSDPGRSNPGRSNLGRSLIAAPVGVLACLVGCLVVLSAAPAQARPLWPDRAQPPGGDRQRALAVLHRWDRDRAAAYAAGSAGSLRRLYASGSAAADADVRTLRAYAARGLTRVRVHTQVFSARVLLDRPRAVALRVVERSFGSAVGPRRCLALPTSAPVTRQVVLRRTEGRWRVATVWR